jgi:RNA polymerase sigma factor (sigma-70 family)
MSTNSEVLKGLRKVVYPPDGGEMTDGALLECFFVRHEEDAFAAIVRRHGSMVLGVCQRVLKNAHDAEDAFQATFLVLVRKATTLLDRQTIGGWLYGVAYKTALKAQAASVRRRQKERQVSEMPKMEPPAEHLWHDLQPLLDQELSRLPEKYRVPVVLCHLEGKSNQEAARLLSCPEGTVSGRLSRARKLLAGRLSSRGITLTAVSLAAVLSQNAASASVPTPVVASTVKAATAVAAGQAAVAAGVISTNVAALTEGVLKAMLLTKLKIATAVLLAVGLVATGVGFAFQQWEVAKQPVKVLAGQEKKDGQKNDKNDGQKGEKDEQKNNKQDGDKNNKKDNNKNNKSDNNKDNPSDNKSDNNKNNKSDNKSDNNKNNKSDNKSDNNKNNKSDNNKNDDQKNDKNDGDKNKKKDGQKGNNEDGERKK